MSIGTENNGRKSINKGIRTEVILKHKYGSKCPICNTGVYQLVFDHIFPRSRGGSDRVINLRLICQRCNRLKADRIISDKYLKKLLKVMEDGKYAKTQTIQG